MTSRASPQHEIAGVQILRALAALAVVVHHTMEESAAAGRVFPGWLTTAGAAGVDVFFVISGFIMLVTTFDLRATPLGPLDFLRKRVVRIYPFYWICCLAMCAMIAAGVLRSMPRDGAFLARSFLLLPSPHFLLGVAWTLAYEVFFYLVFSASLNLKSRGAAFTATSVAIAATVLLSSLGGAGDIQTFLKNPIMLEFAFGLGLAFILRGRPGGPPVWVGGLGALATCLASLLIPHASTNGLTGTGRVLGWGVPSVLIVWSSLAIRDARGRLGRLGVRLGDSSYALYLTHPFVMIAYAFALKHTALRHYDQHMIAPLVVLVAVAVGWWAHKLVEQPLLTALRRGPDRSRGGAAPSLA